MFKTLRGVHAFAFSGAELICLEKAHDGDGVREEFRLPLAPGPIDLTKYDPLVSDFDVTADMVYVHSTNSGRSISQKSAMHTSTAADQNFQPSAKRLQEREVQLLAARIIADDRQKAAKAQRVEQRRRDRVEARRIEREAANPPADPVIEEPTVVEPIDTPPSDPS